MDDMFSGFGGSPFGAAGGRPGAGRSANSAYGGRRREAEPETTVVEKPLPVSLEDIFNGAQKKLKVQRKTFDKMTGKQSVEDKILSVPIKRGLKPGSKIKYPDMGDQVEGGVQDLHFIVKEKPHPLFSGLVAAALDRQRESRLPVEEPKQAAAKKTPVKTR